MKKIVSWLGWLALALAVLLTVKGNALSVQADTHFSGEAPMYRLYNPNSGEHFYTANKAEKEHLDAIGWNYEGVGWYAPSGDEIPDGGEAVPVYRLYNPNAGDHHYTMSAAEKDMLVAVGWNFEGIGWYSDNEEAVPLYRQYNPNAKTGSHNYTTNKAENDYLASIGWKAEGIGWYALREGYSVSGGKMGEEELKEKALAHYRTITGMSEEEVNYAAVGRPAEGAYEIIVGHLGASKIHSMADYIVDEYGKGTRYGTTFEPTLMIWISNKTGNPVDLSKTPVPYTEEQLKQLAVKDYADHAEDPSEGSYVNITKEEDGSYTVLIGRVAASTIQMILCYEINAYGIGTKYGYTFDAVQMRWLRNSNGEEVDLQGLL